ncbi:hypothetical protein R6Q59_029069 [Mikania micrantha]
MEREIRVVRVAGDPAAITGGGGGGGRGRTVVEGAWKGEESIKRSCRPLVVRIGVVVHHKRRMEREIRVVRVAGDPAAITGGGGGGGRGRTVVEGAWKGEESIKR